MDEVYAALDASEAEFKELVDFDNLRAVRSYSLWPSRESTGYGTRHKLQLTPLEFRSAKPGKPHDLGELCLSRGDDNSPRTSGFRITENGTIYVAERENVAVVWGRLFSFIEQEEQRVLGSPDWEARHLGWRNAISIKGINYFARFQERTGQGLAPRIPEDFIVYFTGCDKDKELPTKFR